MGAAHTTSRAAFVTIATIASTPFLPLWTRPLLTGRVLAFGVIGYSIPVERDAENVGSSHAAQRRILCPRGTDESLSVGDDLQFSRIVLPLVEHFPQRVRRIRVEQHLYFGGDIVRKIDELSAAGDRH